MNKNTYFLIIFVLIFCSPVISYCQIDDEHITTEYESLYKQVKANDSLILRKHREYECSKNVFGEVEYYLKNDELKLIIHGYKNDVYDEFSYEHYYLENNKLIMYVKFQEIIRFNSTYFKSKNQSSAGMEKVLDIKETRTFFDTNNKKLACFQRKHMEVYSKWDNDYFNSLELKPVECDNNFEYLINDLNDKYRLLKKAENKLPYSKGRNPKCLFHIW